MVRSAISWRSHGKIGDCEQPITKPDRLDYEMRRKSSLDQFKRSFMKMTWQGKFFQILDFILYQALAAFIIKSVLNSPIFFKILFQTGPITYAEINNCFSLWRIHLARIISSIFFSSLNITQIGSLLLLTVSVWFWSDTKTICRAKPLPTGWR